jgi:NNP family nitrate/nitrite transporter-like MFS transporter
MFAVIPCLATALAQDFNQLVISRLLMGIVGSGFVVGIRMVAEWFQPKEMGVAQGIYGGWGNFGAFGAEFALPMIAVSTSFLAGGASNWRLAIAFTGIIAAIYGVIYYNSVQDTPTGKVYNKPKKNGSLEVTSIKSFWAMMISNFGLISALGLLAWRLEQKNIHFLSLSQMYLTWLLLAGLFAYQSYKAWEVNRELLTGKKTYAASERFQFGQIALLEFTYITSFGSELAVVSMLPAFFEKTFGLEHILAGMIAATYPFLNLVSRPSGGLISDKSGSRKWTITIISVGISVSYFMAHFINNSWPIPVAIAVIMFAAYFAQAGCGATYSIVPMIKKEATGQIAGNVGAYGNFGAVVYLTIFSLTDAATLFSTMGIATLICAFMCAFFLKEPKGSFALAYEGEALETATTIFLTEE